MVLGSVLVDCRGRAQARLLSRLGEMSHGALILDVG